MFNYSCRDFSVNSIDNAPFADNLNIDGMYVTLQLDTIATTTIILTNVWHRLSSSALARLPDLDSCTLDLLRELGEWRLHFTYKQQTKKLSCVVTSSIRSALSSREWIDAFELLDFSEVQAVSLKLSLTIANLL